MNKEKGILIAGAVGLLAAVGIFALRRFFSSKEYRAYYTDYHQNFSNFEAEDYHGIEYLALR